MVVSAGPGSCGEASTRRSLHCQSLLVFQKFHTLHRGLKGGGGGGEPSRKAGSPKLHPSKPGGTFVRREARQVEVEMQEEESCASSQPRKGTGLYPYPWGGPDYRPLPPLSGGPPSAHPQWHTPAGTSLSVGPLHLRGLTPGKSFPAARPVPVTLWAQLSASSLAWYLLQRAPPPLQPVLAPGDNPPV